MRLLNAQTGKLSEFLDTDAPPYAILSHRWGSEEVSFGDLQLLGDSSILDQSPTTAQQGHAKIKGCSEQAMRDGLRWIWVDTCCIDKSSSAELSEAINSMFRWYRNSTICYVYLADVLDDRDHFTMGSGFCSSNWFQRGWTLQELLAPTRLFFFDASWKVIGELLPSSNLSKTVSDITQIPSAFLGGGDVRIASVAQRMSWASNRTTTRLEDMAYCLLGIFDVNMALLYGEGDRAFIRLQEEILKQKTDHTIFAWGSRPTDIRSIISLGGAGVINWTLAGIMARRNTGGMLARSPADFAGCGSLVPSQAKRDHSPTSFEVTNQGIRIELPFFVLSSIHGAVLGILNCHDSHDPSHLIGLIMFTSPKPFWRLFPFFIPQGATLRKNSEPPVKWRRERMGRTHPQLVVRTVYVNPHQVEAGVHAGDGELASSLRISGPTGFAGRVLHAEPFVKFTRTSLASDPPVFAVSVDPNLHLRQSRLMPTYDERWSRAPLILHFWEQTTSGDVSVVDGDGSGGNDVLVTLHGPRAQPNFISKCTITTIPPPTVTASIWEASTPPDFLQLILCRSPANSNWRTARTSVVLPRHTVRLQTYRASSSPSSHLKLVHVTATPRHGTSNSRSDGGGAWRWLSHFTSAFGLPARVMFRIARSGIWLRAPGLLLLLALMTFMLRGSTPSPVSFYHHGREDADRVVGSRWPLKAVTPTPGFATMIVALAVWLIAEPRQPWGHQPMTFREEASYLAALIAGAGACLWWGP